MSQTIVRFPKSVQCEIVWSDSSGRQNAICMTEALGWYPALSVAAASLANNSIHVCLRVDVRLCLCMCVFSVNKGRREQKVSSNTKTPQAHVHLELILMTGEISLHGIYKYITTYTPVCFCRTSEALRDCINMVSEWWDVPSIHLLCCHLHFHRAPVGERQVDTCMGREDETRRLSVAGARTASLVTCGAPRLRSHGIF